MTQAKTASFSIVVPTIRRESLYRLLTALEDQHGPSPESVVIVDDRPGRAPTLQVDSSLPVTVLRSGGRGPAAARNTGWRATTTRWVCFVDDDVVTPPGWLAALAADLRGADDEPGAERLADDGERRKREESTDQRGDQQPLIRKMRRHGPDGRLGDDGRDERAAQSRGVDPPPPPGGGSGRPRRPFPAPGRAGIPPGGGAASRRRGSGGRGGSHRAGDVFFRASVHLLSSWS